MSRAGSADAVFAALGDPTRRSVLRRLATGGPASATALAEGATISRQAIDKHLRVLGDAGLVVTERVGREVRWQAQPVALDDAVAWLVETGAAWDRRLDRLQRGAAAADRRRTPDRRRTLKRQPGIPG